MRWTMLFLALALPALGQTRGPFQGGANAPPLRANTQGGVPGLNDVLGTKADVVGGVLTNPTLNGRTLTSRDTDIIQAVNYGVKCDGTTDDSPALQAALNAGSALGGRTVMLPATGHACRLASGIALSDDSHSGNTLQGSAAGLYWPGPYDNTEAHWTQFGTWIRCEDLTNSCITMNGDGSALKNLNFWYVQPSPPANTGCGVFCNMTHNWTPIPYPYTVTVGGPQNFNSISDINIVNATNCLDFEGSSSGVNTIYTYVSHVSMGCFDIGTKFNRVDNVVDMHNVHYNLWWYPFSSDVIGYTEGDTTHPGHKIDWDAYYLSNLTAESVEFYQSWAAMRITDTSVESGLGTVTFGAQAIQLANVQFNQVCQAVILGSNRTHFNGVMTNVELNVDPQTSNSTQCAGATPVAFNLNSPNVDLKMSNLQVLFAQTIAAVGSNDGTTGGVLHVNNVSAQNYSAYLPTGAAFIAQGGYIDVPNGLNWLFTQNANAGPHIAGIPGSAVSAGYDVEGPAGTPRQMRFYSTPATGFQYDLTRWGWRTDSSAEGGDNAGSNFNLDRYNDDGTYHDSPIEVSRSTGQVYLPNGVKIVLPTSCTGQPAGTLWNNVGAVGLCP